MAVIGVPAFYARTQIPPFDTSVGVEDPAMLDAITFRTIRESPYFLTASPSQDRSAEDDATMPEYEMPIEEQLKILVRKFASLEASLDERFDRVDKRFDRVDERLDSVDGQLDGVDERLDTIDGRLGRIEIRLDDTHAIAKMGLEAVDALRDSMSQKFASAEKKQKEEIELLKTVIVHVRKRVEVVERRRRS